MVLFFKRFILSLLWLLPITANGVPHKTLHFKGPVRTYGKWENTYNVQKFIKLLYFLKREVRNTTSGLGH